MTARSSGPPAHRRATIVARERPLLARINRVLGRRGEPRTAGEVDALVDALVDAAMGGNVEAITLIWDACDGPVRQRVDITSGGERVAELGSA